MSVIKSTAYFVNVTIILTPYRPGMIWSDLFLFLYDIKWILRERHLESKAVVKRSLKDAPEYGLEGTFHLFSKNAQKLSTAISKKVYGKQIKTEMYTLCD